MFDLRTINMSSECEYDWYWKISVCSSEYEVCDSFASPTRHQASYSGSAGWNFRYQSIHIQITYISYSTKLDILCYEPSELDKMCFISGRSRDQEENGGKRNTVDRLPAWWRSCQLFQNGSIQYGCHKEWYVLRCRRNCKIRVRLVIMVSSATSSFTYLILSWLPPGSLCSFVIYIIIWFLFYFLCIWKSIFIFLLPTF